MPTAMATKGYLRFGERLKSSSIDKVDLLPEIIKFLVIKNLSERRFLGLADHHTRLINNREFNKIRLNNTLRQENKLLIKYFFSDIIAQPIFIVKPKSSFINRLNKGECTIFYHRE